MEFGVKVYGGKKVADRSAIYAFGSRSEPRRSGEATSIPKVDKTLEKGSKIRAETACAVRRDTSLLMHRTCVDKTKDEMNPVTCKMRLITLACRRIMRYYLGVSGRCSVIASSDPFDHSIQYANAGHAPALHFEAATGEFVPLESTGMPLGVVDRPAYHQGWPLTLELGDLLVFCTDGVVEASA